MHAAPTLPSHSGSVKRIVLGIFVAALLVNFWAVTKGWNRSLRDGHEFRQHQTALTAFYLKKEGLRLDYETPVLGPPWSIPMEFPTYQAVAAKLSNLLGLPLEQAGRMTGILFFYATIPAIWLLLGRRLPDKFDRLVVITPVLLCPVFLFYSRTFMIESTALCFTAWFLAGFDAMLDRPRAGVILLVWTAGTLAALTKVTTFAASWIFVGFLTLGAASKLHREGKSWVRASILSLSYSLLALSFPAALGAAWTVYSDHLKEIHPYAHILTSQNLRPFTLGTLEQRMSYDWWQVIGRISFKQVLALPGLLMLLAGLPFVAQTYRRPALACIAGYTGGFLLFSNLYFIHDYYFYASAAFLLTAFGLILAGLLHLKRLPKSITLLLVAIGLTGEINAFAQTYYSFYQRTNEPIPFEAEVIQRLTPQDSVFVGMGYDWNCLLPYYSERRGILPFIGNSKDFDLLDRSLSQLGSQRVDTVIVTSYFRTEYPFIQLLRDHLQLTSSPVIKTADADIYVRKDRAAEVAKILSARSDWNNAQFNPQPDADLAMPLFYYDLTVTTWLDRFTMTSPKPFVSRGPVEIGLLPLDDKLVISTQAPTELHFHPPSGSRSISAIGGMVPSSYTEGHTTPGVVLNVFEETPDGRRRRIFHRRLAPLTEPADRGDVIINYEQEQPFTGTLIFAHDAIPSGNVSYSWSYWKQITIR